MTTITLKASQRNKDTPISDLIQDRKIPAVLYGFNKDSQSIVVDYEAFRKVLRQVLNHVVFSLEVDGKTFKVIIKDYQKDPVRCSYIHVDFFVIDEKKPIIVPIPVKEEGDSPVLKLGAILFYANHFVKVKCLPKDIPSELVVDISCLKEKGDKIILGDLERIEGVDFLNDDKFMLIKADIPRVVKAVEDEEGEGEAGVEDEGGEETKEGEDKEGGKK